MNFEQAKALDKANYMNTFGERMPIMFTHGKGAVLYDTEGKAYTDFLAGIAVNALGYGDGGLLETINTQAQKLIHCSNYFYTPQQALLAERLIQLTCADRVFFSNSGAEANEAAIKLARKYFHAQGIDRYEIISADNSFHGRTLATLAATGQEKYREAYRPLPGGFINVPYGDADAILNAMGPKTAAVLLEPIQGEGGIIEGGGAYLTAVRKLCTEQGVLLIFDEIQSGMGRTGSLFAHQHYGVEPDIFTVAKALAGGLPLGAVLAREFCCCFKPGDHGTTFGGNPLSCAAALYVTGRIAEPSFLNAVKEKGAYLQRRLKELLPHPLIREIRGVGLFTGVEIDAGLPVKEVQMALLDKGFITGTAGNNTLRLVPPLTIEEGDMAALAVALGEILDEKGAAKNEGV